MKSEKPREYTEEEVTKMFFEHIWSIINEWHRYPDKTSKERTEGAIFSVLAMLDGCSIGVPGFIVAPCPHEEDKDYLIQQGENYFVENDEFNIKCDIAGSLHDQFYKHEPENVKTNTNRIVIGQELKDSQKIMYVFDNELTEMSLDELSGLLDKAIIAEEYERAAQIKTVMEHKKSKK